MVSNTSYRCSICKVESTHSAKFDDYSQTCSSLYNSFFATVCINFALVPQKYQSLVGLFFGKFAIVYLVMERCTWICTYLQYHHV